jgi:ubiquinone biosynthesis protein UbiJ
MSMTDLAFASLEEAINRGIALDPETADKLARLHGRVIAIEIAGPELRLYMVPGPGRLQVLSRFEGEPDCLLRGSPFALACMDAKGEKGAEQLFSGKVEISGDTELAHRFGTILGGLEIDWEGRLAQFTGDTLAHEIGDGVRSVARWGRRTLDTLGKDLREYVQDEVRLLPERQEIQAYLDKVDALRDDVERMEARIRLLAAELSVPQGGEGP